MSILRAFDSKVYAKLAHGHAAAYAQAEPFPHVVFDDFLPQDVAVALARAFPLPGDSQMGNWKLHENANTTRWFQEDTSQLPDPLREFAAACSSRPFMQFLATLTGISSLLADPYFIGGGAMLSGKGGFLNIHADFNWHALLQSWRRVNALFYLTPDWDDKWGGALELWSRDGSQQVAAIEPRFNRAVVFSTSSDSFHGQPEPLSCPPERSRNIFSAFYYTTEMGERTDKDPHFTKYALSASPYGSQVLEGYVPDPPLSDSSPE